MIARIVRALRRRPTMPTLPVNASDDYCRAGCWTPPGREHELSCPEVTPEQMRRYLGGFR